MAELIECVPNFSDGRRPQVYNAIADAIRAVRGARILDISSDADHNRTVITFVGDRNAVEEAAFNAIKTAAQLIDLEQHEGEHPRIGATDVVPFIPVSGVTMEECAELAHRLGRRIGEQLGIAVYMYANAATRPERVKLANIRKGEYEAWRAEVENDPAREPDYGPARPQPWGATVIGARPYLLAYNIYLNTGDVEKAKQVAKAVRATSGGLQNVQAMGFMVEGQAQVSMNLLDFTRTPIYRVQEMVRREAHNLGLTITHSELVGLAPQKAFVDSATWYLQLDGFEPQQLLENRIRAVEEADDGLESKLPIPFLEAVAAAQATPGGGSVAALSGALSAALIQMVAGLTVGRKKYAGVDERASAILARADELRHELTAAIVADSAAFDELFAIFRDKELSDELRSAAAEKATVKAGEVPLNVVHLSKKVAELALEIAQIGNTNAATDAAAAGIMARAAAQIAALNVRINAASLQDKQNAARWLDVVEKVCREVGELAQEIQKTAAERGGY